MEIDSSRVKNDRLLSNSSLLLSHQPIDVQLHDFCDASERAYAAVVFVRNTYSNGQVEVRLVASKERVAPIKRQTIPRLELLGALILSRLVSKLKSLNWHQNSCCFVD